MPREYKYPVWGTQGGGLVREVNGACIFVEKPDCAGLDVGDEMPKEWDLIPANHRARLQMEAEDPLARIDPTVALALWMVAEPSC